MAVARLEAVAFTPSIKRPIGDSETVIKGGAVGIISRGLLSIKKVRVRPITTSSYDCTKRLASISPVGPLGEGQQRYVGTICVNTTIIVCVHGSISIKRGVTNKGQAACRN